MDNETYYTYIQIPLFILLLTLVWLLILIRLRVFLHNHLPFLTFRGTSTLLLLLAGVLCTTYTSLLTTSYFLNASIKRIRQLSRPSLPNPGNFPDRDPMFFTDAEVATIISLVQRIIKVIYWSRFFLVVTLWVLKAAFLTIFWETRGMLETAGKRVLYVTSVVVGVTFVLAVWNVAKDMENGIWSLVPTEGMVRRGAMYSGARFIYHDADVELMITAMNMLTDLMLGVVATQTLRSFKLPLRTLILPCTMLGVMILFAVARFILIVMTKNVQSYENKGVIEFELVAELEVFVGAAVACAPGLRAWWRGWMLRGRDSGDGVVETVGTGSQERAEEVQRFADIEEEKPGDDEEKKRGEGDVDEEKRGVGVDVAQGRRSSESFYSQREGAEVKEIGGVL